MADQEREVDELEEKLGELSPKEAERLLQQLQSDRAGSQSQTQSERDKSAEEAFGYQGRGNPMMGGNLMNHPMAQGMNRPIHPMMSGDQMRQESMYPNHPMFGANPMTQGMNPSNHPSNNPRNQTTDNQEISDLKERFEQLSYPARSILIYKFQTGIIGERLPSSWTSHVNDQEELEKFEETLLDRPLREVLQFIRSPYPHSR